MKTLGKLQINPERIIRTEELKTLRGGFGVLICHRSWILGGDCDMSGNDIFCDDRDRILCDFFCTGWTSSVCVGGSY
jgi:hypothetical protein